MARIRALLPPKTYLLRNIPARLWANAQERAEDEGYSLRVVILRQLEEYVKRGFRR